MIRLLDGHVYTLPPGARGFDCVTPLTARTAQAFKDAQFDFAVRYCWRKSRNSYDLTYEEADIILAVGLALMVVQHVHPDSAKPGGWTPSADLGTEYGDTASMHAELIGLPPGINAWEDWEGVNPRTPKDMCIDFHNNWHSRVAASGYVPGLYVGFSPVLSGAELYRWLRFTHYWGAYNRDFVPLPRGYQMQQHERKISEIPPGIARDFAFDTNTVKLDGLRGLPIALSRATPVFTDVEAGASSTA